jgi:hypothetical protein
MKSKEINNYWSFFMTHSVIGTEIASNERLFEIFHCVFCLENSHLNLEDCFEIFCKNQKEKYTEEVYLRGKEISFPTFVSEVKKIRLYLEEKVVFQTGKDKQQDKYIKNNPKNKKDEDKKSRNSRPDAAVRKWLKEGYPEWSKAQGNDLRGSTTRELWEKLKDLGYYNQQKIDVELEPSSADDNTRQIKLKIIAEAGSKIVILTRDKEGSGGIFCVCPSELAPKLNLENQELIISQKILNNSENQYWLWCIFNKIDLEDPEVEIDLSLPWLDEASKFKNYELNSFQLWELLTQVELYDAKVFYADKPIKRGDKLSRNIKLANPNELTNNHSFLKDPLFKAAIAFLLKLPEYSGDETRRKLNNWISLSFSDEPQIILDYPEDIDNLINRFVYLGLFKNPEIAREFFLTTYNRYNIDEIAAKERFVTRNSKYGKKFVLEVINTRIESIKLVDYNQKAIEDLRILLMSESSLGIIDKLEELAKHYNKSAKTHTPHRMNSYTISDFDKNFWKNIVFTSQQDLIPDRKNHLHKANEVIGKEVAEILKQEFETRPPSEQQNITLKIIEGGVGGLNTTCELMKHIVAQIDKLTTKTSIKEIQFKGFDINPAVAAYAEAIITSSTLAKDKRCQFFSKLQNSGKLKPLDHKNYSQFIFPEDMFEGIQSMVEPHQKDIDIFVCSYALHHVHNGEALRSALFDPYCKEEYRMTRENHSDFFDELGKSLQQIRDEDIITSLSPEVEVFLSIFEPCQGKIDEEKVKDIDKIIEYIKSGKDLRSKEAYEYSNLIDRQYLLLRSIYDLLRPNGLIVIADPDGFSKFNLENVPINSEMSVANFSDSNKISVLLDKLGFDIIMSTIQGRDGNDYYEGAEGKNTDRSEDVDRNMGYIIIAKKKQKRIY